MSAIAAPARGPEANPSTIRPGLVEDRPQPADGLELVGQFEGSGYKDPPYLARRSDGQVIQLSRLLYLVAEAADGRRSLHAIADRVGSRIGRRVSADNVRFLVERKLRPLGVLAGADGSTPELAQRPAMLALRHRRPFLSARAARVLGTAFAPLFASPVVAVVLAALAAFGVWLYGFHGVAGGLRSVLYEPTLLLALLVAVIAATLLHEIGHAAACCHGGARAGPIGAGVYLVWPAFYCDVTDAYRLDRRGRLRTDLGGIYLNAIVSLVAGGAYFATGQEPLLLLAVVQHITILQQLLPLLRFDGYYIVSDLTGVPDILSRIGPILRSLLPFREAEPPVRQLKPWVRVTVTAYVALLVPVLLLLMAWIVIGAPRVLATAFDSLGLQADRLAEAFRRREWSVTGLSAFQIAALVLQCGAISLLLGRMGRSTVRGLRRWSQGRPARRAVVLAGVSAAAITAIGIWWPNGDYRPLQPGDRGTVPEALSAVRDVPASNGPRSFAPPPTAAVVESGSHSPDPGAATPDPGAATPDPGAATPDPVTSAPSGAPPARHSAQSPPAGGGDESTTDGEQAYAGSTMPGPGPPTRAAEAPGEPTSPGATVTPEPTPSGGPVENAAVAINTADRSLVFRLALDLRLITDGVVDATNLAVAQASCVECRTVAIAVQIVIAIGDARVRGATNEAISLNAACPACETLAYAYQLVFGRDEPVRLTEEGRNRLAAVIAALTIVGTSDAPIALVSDQVDVLMGELREVVATELVPVDVPDAAAPEPTATPSREPTATTSPQPTATSSPEPTTTSSPEPTATSSPEPTTTSSPEPTTTSSPEPTTTPQPDQTVAPDPTPTTTPESTPTPTSPPAETATPTP